MVAETTGQAGVSIGSGAPAKARQRPPLIVFLLITGMMVPLFIHVGPLRLTPYRLVLIIGFFPALFAWLSGRAGRIRLADLCVVAICLWSSLSFSVVHGFNAMIEPIGIFWVETLGAYLLARCYIRTPEAFYATVRLFFVLGILMIPFAIYETITGQNLILRIVSNFGPTFWDNYMDPRWGLDRVQGPFPHQIHFGVFFLCLSGMIYYVLGYGLPWVRRVGQMLTIALLGATSLSSGPLVALMGQIYVIVWDGVMTTVKERWKILVGLSVAGFVVVDLISNRTPFHVVIEYLAFNKHTAYNRIYIWNWGVINIFNHPLFGNGFNDWVRPSYMSGSVDMFWIVGAMRHGIPVWILWFAFYFLIFLPVAFRRGLSDRVNWYRTGFLITIFGLFAAGWTVHYWDVSYALFMFLMASGMWILDWEDGGEEEKDDDAGPRVAGYTRFPPKPR